MAARRSARVLLLCVLAGCAGSARLSAPAAGSDCLIIDGPGQPRTELAVLAPVEASHAPVPRNAAERLVFAQLYETLVRADCTGAVVGVLAESWTSLPDGSWSFRLRDDARFTDGTPLTARAVIDAWAASADGPAFAWVSAAGARELRVAPAHPVRDVRAFADPALAVARSVDGRWPLGTGRYRAETTADGDTRLVRSDARDGAPDTLAVVVVDDADARGALDRGADVLVTGDPDAVAYARALAGYRVTPLPWSRTYAVVVSSGAAGHAPDSARAALAREAAPEGVRAAQRVSATALACPSASGAKQPRAPAAARQPVILYERGDDVAGRLAERLTALAWPPARAPAWLDDLLPDIPGTRAPRAAGLTSTALAAAVESGSYLAAIVALPGWTSTSCPAGGVRVDAVVRTLLEDAASYGYGIEPLVDARDFLVHRERVGRVRVNDDGTIRFGGR